MYSFPLIHIGYRIKIYKKMNSTFFSLAISVAIFRFYNSKGTETTLTHPQPGTQLEGATKHQLWQKAVNGGLNMLL